MVEASPVESPVSLIVGLGNPGESYALTRHNVGFLALDYVVQVLGGRWEKAPQCKALIAKVNCEGQPVVFLKPQTYMNLSGAALAAYTRYYRLTNEQFAVVYDDVTCNLGKIKVGLTQTPGSHNGMRSIVDHVGSGFFRFRLGVGPKASEGMQLADFVLAPFSKEQLALLPTVFEDFFQKLKLLLAYGPVKAMNIIHLSA